MSNFFKLKHVHVNKDKIKASFDITVKKVDHLTEVNGKPVNLSWKRGKRPANAGSLKDVVVENGEAVWDEKIAVQVTLFKETGVDKFDEKALLLQLNQGNKVVGKLKIDLGEVAKSDGTTTIEFPFEKKKTQTPSIHVQVHARWLKLNDRLLVRLDENASADGAATNGHHASRGQVEIDGHAYNLRTDDALTEPSVDTTSGSWEEEDEAKEHYGHNEHDPFTTASVVEAETRKFQDELESLRKQLRLVEGQSSERAKTIELQEKEIHALRGKVVENEELVQRAMGMEGFMDQQMALLRQEHEETIRQLKQQHASELEAEVDRHREEMETALTRAQLCLLSPSLPHNNPANPPTVNNTQEVTNITIERDELVQQRDNLQQKVLLVTKELEETARSLLSFDERLSKKDAKIVRLKDEIKSLYLSLSNITESNQALKEKTKSMKRKMSSEPYSEVQETVRSSIKPLFDNRLLDKYWGLLYLFAFSAILVLHHMLGRVFADGDNP